MTGFEPLSRASCFAVGTTFVCSQHVLFPWLFPAYYAADKYPFVHLLTERDVRVVVGDSWQLNGLRRCHPTRDVCIVHSTADDIRQCKSPQLELDPRPLAEGEPLTFHGHNISTSVTLDEEPPMEARVVSGVFIGASSAGQCFAHTASELVIGMCGGPVLDGAGKCVGVVEGVVPRPLPKQRGPTRSQQTSRAVDLLRGAAVFIPASDVAQLLE